MDTSYPVGPVHVYTTRLDGRLVLFDTGPPTKDAIQYHRDNLDLSQLEYVFITHFHPDHIGLAKFFSENTGAVVVASKYDTFRYEKGAQMVEAMISIFQEMGFSSQETEKSRKTIEWFEKSTPFAREYLVLEDQEELLKNLGLGYIRCPGHSQSDIVYTIGDSAITGDILLREIFQTPLLDVDMETMNSRFCNYTAYCETVDKLKHIENMKFYPSHREYVDSVDQRITWYVGKLLDRAAIAGPILANGASISGTVKLLFGPMNLDPFSMFIKISEIAFIQDFLSNPDRLVTAVKKAGLLGELEEKLNKLDGLLS